MAKQQSQQENAAQMAALKERLNSEYMRLSYPQFIKFNAENGTDFGPGKNLTFNAPIINGGNAFGVILKVDLDVTWTPGTTGTVTPCAAYPESLVSKLSVQFGNPQITSHPFIYRVLDLMEGYGRTTQDDVRGTRNAKIDSMLRQVPQTLVAGVNKVKFEVNIPLNSLHPASTNGAIPIGHSGTRLQVGLQLPSAIVGKDPMLNVFDVTGDGAIEVSGTIRPVLEYRDHNSFTTVQPLRLDLSNISTVQTIELPSITGLSQGQYNHMAFKNPYLMPKAIHIVIDGNQSDKFSAADNITGFSYDTAENSNSNLFKYDESTTGIEGWYKKVRSTYGNDLPEGVLAWDTTSENIANVSSKLGSAYLNLSSNGYSSARMGVKVETVDNTNISSRIVSYGIIVNDMGIQTV
jgi:hypothetical protein